MKCLELNRKQFPAKNNSVILTNYIKPFLLLSLLVVKLFSMNPSCFHKQLYSPFPLLPLFFYGEKLNRRHLDAPILFLFVLAPLSFSSLLNPPKIFFFFFGKQENYE